MAASRFLYIAVALTLILTEVAPRWRAGVTPFPTPSPTTASTDSPPRSPSPSSPTPAPPLLCRNMGDVTQGRYFDNPERWVPDSCELKHDVTVASRSVNAECFKTLRVYAVTDSIGREILNNIEALYEILRRHVDMGNDDRHITAHAWNPYTSRRFGYLTQDLKTDSRVFLREKANFVIFSSGLWDMGHFFCGPAHYFDFLILKIRRYMMDMRPHARSVLMNIPHVNNSDNATLGWGRNCNPPGKMAVFRNALQLVSACTGVPIFDMNYIQRSNPEFSPDGIHLRGKGLRAGVGVMLNTMCLPPETRLQPFLSDIPCTPESIAEAKLRWASVPIANVHSEGCPKPVATHCFNTPDEYLHQLPAERNETGT